jgi:hypothetical protein
LLACLRSVGRPLGLRHFALVSDTSDLWALLMLPLALAYGWKRLKAASPAPTATSSSGGRRPNSW